MPKNRRIFDRVYVNATSQGLVIIQRSNEYRTKENLVTRVTVDI